MKTMYFYLIAFCAFACSAKAQKPFTEGIITYAISADDAGGNTKGQPVTGTITIAVKGSLLKKEIKMSNGYEDVLIFNTAQNTLYSLKNAPGKKYAIQLDIQEYRNKQKEFAGFAMQDNGSKKNIAGYDCQPATVKYKDGSTNSICYTASYYPTDAVMFQQFPGIKVWPLSYNHVAKNGMTIHLEAAKMEARPVENAVFMIPKDYKLITNKEYQEMNK